MTDQIILDCNQKPISVGSRILAGYTVESLYDKRAEATVYEITDVDADYDDNLQRAVMYEPKVKVRYDDGDTDSIGTSYVPVMTNPGAMYFIAEDLEVISTDTDPKGN